MTEKGRESIQWVFRDACFEIHTALRAGDKARADKFSVLADALEDIYPQECNAAADKLEALANMAEGKI